MRAGFIMGLLAVLTGCVQRPMTIQQWRAEQAKKARMEQIRREGKSMSDTPVVFTKEEQAQGGNR
jgi:hypothetical protein